MTIKMYKQLVKIDTESINQTAMEGNIIAQNRKIRNIDIFTELTESHPPLIFQNHYSSPILGRSRDFCLDIMRKDELFEENYKILKMKINVIKQHSIA